MIYLFSPHRTDLEISDVRNLYIQGYSAEFSLNVSSSYYGAYMCI